MGEPLPAGVTRDEFGEPVVHVPALGWSAQVVIGFVASVVFTVFGVSAGAAVINGQLAARPVDRPFYLAAGLVTSMLASGVLCLVYTVVEMFRRFEFRMDAEGLHRTIVWGPFRFQRTWQHDEVVGTMLRSTDMRMGKQRYARLMLVLVDGESVPLFPHRKPQQLVAIDAALNALIEPGESIHRSNDVPLGGGLSVVEGPNAFEITANPISPRLVPGDFYVVAAFAAFVDISLSLCIVAAVWNEAAVRHPMFWFTMLGQLLTIAIGSIVLRRWIRGVAARSYEITIDSSEVTVVTTTPASTTTEKRKIADVR